MKRHGTRINNSIRSRLDRPTVHFARMLSISGIVLLLALGCAQKSVRTGFLGDYTDFQQDPQDESVLYWEKPGVDWGKFKKFIIDPIVVYYHPDSKPAAIQPDELKMLTDYFREVLIEEVEKVSQVVDKPGPDVLRVQAAITDVVPSNPALNVVTSLALLVPLDMGGASMEAQFLDSQTNERLAAVVDSKSGTPVDIKFYQGFTKLGHAKAAFREWAVALREAFEEPEPEE